VPDFLPLPTVGRRFTGGQRVRLGDTDPHGRLRPDAAARYMHDVAGDDWDGHCCVERDATWPQQGSCLGH
jgi:hypothetical protein